MYLQVLVLVDTCMIESLKTPNLRVFNCKIQFPLLIDVKFKQVQAFKHCYRATGFTVLRKHH